MQSFTLQSKKTCFELTTGYNFAPWKAGHRFKLPLYNILVVEEAQLLHLEFLLCARNPKTVPQCNSTRRSALSPACDYASSSVRHRLKLLARYKGEYYNDKVQRTQKHGHRTQLSCTKISLCMTVGDLGTRLGTQWSAFWMEIS